MHKNTCIFKFIHIKVLKTDPLNAHVIYTCMYIKSPSLPVPFPCQAIMNNTVLNFTLYSLSMYIKFLLNQFVQKRVCMLGFFLNVKLFFPCSFTCRDQLFKLGLRYNTLTGCKQKHLPIHIYIPYANQEKPHFTFHQSHPPMHSNVHVYNPFCSILKIQVLIFIESMQSKQ